MNKEKFWCFVYWAALIILSALLGALTTILIILLNKKEGFVEFFILNN